MVVSPQPVSAPSKEWSLEVDSASPESWAAELENFEDATIYQTWSYGEISWGRSQLSHLLLKQAGQVVAMAQLRLVRIPILGWGVAYLRWGPLWRRKASPADPALLEHMLQALRAEYVQRRKLLLRILPHAFAGDPLEREISAALRQTGLAPASTRPYRTFLLDLAPPLEQLRKKLDQKWRNQLNRAEKNQLTVLEGTDDRLYSLFASIYEEMMERKAFDTSVDIREFERIQRHLPESQKMLTLVALKEDQPISALVGSITGATGIYLLGATSNEGMQQKGSYLLQWRMIQRLKERGAHFYDLGGINPEHNPGVYHFKSGFGAADTTQLGQFELTGSPFSSLLVRLAERCRQNRRSSTPAPASNPVTPPVPAAAS